MKITYTKIDIFISFKQMSQPTISTSTKLTTLTKLTKLTTLTTLTKNIIDEKPRQNTSRIGCGIMLLGHDD